MANVNVSLIDYQFTASLISSVVSVNSSGTQVTVVNTSKSITIGNTTTTVEVVNNGIMTILSASTATVDEFVGNGVYKLFELSQEVLGQNYVEVAVGGVLQAPGEFSGSTSTIVNGSFAVQTINTGSVSAKSFVIFGEAPPAVDLQARFFSVRVAQDIQGPQGIPGP